MCFKLSDRKNNLKLRLNFPRVQRFGNWFKTLVSRCPRIRIGRRNIYLFGQCDVSKQLVNILYLSRKTFCFTTMANRSTRNCREDSSWHCRQRRPGTQSGRTGDSIGVVSFAASLLLKYFGSGISQDEDISPASSKGHEL